MASYRALFRAGTARLLALAGFLALLSPAAASGQTPAGPDNRNQATSDGRETIELVAGTSSVVDHTGTLERVSIADPAVADAVVVSAQEVVVNGKAPGRTTLLLWDEEGQRRTFSVRVTADAASLQHQVNLHFEPSDVRVSASGNTLILSGTVTDPGVEEQVVSLARSLAGETPLINQIEVPERGQILLKVRFAEINRSALNELGSELFTVEHENVCEAICIAALRLKGVEEVDVE